ncbi:Zn-dependent hydrolase [Neisseria leonii]|uniref:Zn-dependent hydrolase n=1 Tax=Neisseria leonii TaxID=2995413 RepID=UPI00237A1DA1|nr:Zn-dependent hydrolase [Neisseria sp. 3986]MDD9325061.1 Zn-dependent hydrolase [Neisseria sp. 3986]
MQFIDNKRYWQQLMTLGEITDPERPYMRRSFTDLFVQGRDWLAEQMRAAGLTVFVDEAGNLIGRRAGKHPGSGCIMMGSHSDSVPSGGRFDGIAGVIAALECVQALNTHGIELEHDLEIVDFLAEEPSEWGISCVGSRGISGFLDKQLLAAAHPKSGETLAAAVGRMGGQPENLKVRKDIKAFLELHIEQGAVLERDGIHIGVVSGIVGILRLNIVLQGQAAHAGTSPMDFRRDTLAAAAVLISEAERLANGLSARQQGYFVATCGEIHNKPNASNVVSGQTQIVLDIRSDNRVLMDEFQAELHQFAENMTRQRNLCLSVFERVTDTYPMQCDERLMQLIEASAGEAGISYRRMPSGAGHDAAFIGKIAPAAMIFVPSVEGKSHCPDEWTHEEDLSRGVEVLMRTLLKTDLLLTQSA